MKNTNQHTEFIIALTEHRIFGHILAPFFIQLNEHGAFYTITEPVLKQDVLKIPERFNEVQKKLVGLIEKYSDENLARRFSRKYGSTEFFQHIDTEFFNEHVTPFIDKQIVECIHLIREHDVKLYFKPAKYNNIYEEDRITIGKDFAKPIFHFELNEDGLKYYIEIQFEDKPLPLLYKKPIFITDSPCRLVIQNRLISFEKLSGKRLKPFLVKENMNIPPKMTDKYLRSFVYGVVREHEVVAKGFEIIHVQSETKAIISLEQGLNLEPILVLSFQYGNKQFKAGRKGTVEVELNNRNGKYIFYKHRRDMIWEQKIVSFFKDRGLTISGDQLVFQAKGDLVNNEQGYARINWLNHNQSEIKGFGIVIEQNFPEHKFYTGNLDLQVATKMEGDWFDIYAVVTLGQYKIPFIRLKRNILSGKREYVLPNGEVVILPLEWFQKYNELLPFAEGSGEHLKLSKHHFGLIEQQIQGIDEALLEEINKLQPHNYKLYNKPEGLNATLRHYQLEGFSWMQNLRINHFGGCLADDMGLGKTLQTLTLLLSVKKNRRDELVTDLTAKETMGQLFSENKVQTPASLIVVPTSLIHNWHNEVKKFTPQLKLYKHVGSQRKRIANLKGIVDYYDVIITTYGTIRNDYRLFENLVFDYLILDESQYIKNAGSKTYNAVCALQSNHKLVLTGTPIENSLSDLWSQINFLNRGLLGNLSFFKKEFILPIEKNSNEEKQEQLYRIISPFILRRTKDEVAKDLPSLTEQIRYCEMSESQAKIYEEEKSSIRNSILENIEKQGMHKISFLALQGLTRLRQLANHPALLKYDKADSGKFDEVIRSLENLMAEKHKVLIFSSFVTHLKLFQDELENRGWNYCMLTGQTRDREQVIRQFQENEKKRIFLISLKAGGVGLNLTSADYIFILDPWWNPAAENQAVNRAHRIGQDKKVFVYRFITEDSIEEKIQVLKERKMALADQFIHTNNPFQTVSTEEIVGLFD